MINKLGDSHFCSKRTKENNVQFFIELEATNESNKIPFACVNLLLNNLENVDILLMLKTDILEKVLCTIPSQMRTLLCLDNFKYYLEESLKKNPSGKAQYELVKNTNYKEMSLALIEKTIIQPGQMAFIF